jgi:PPP family 3-phenylpropionic acid transporter
MAVTTAAGLSGVIGLAYTLAFGFAPLLAVSMAHAAVTASLAPLSDALSVTASAEGRAFQYGLVRGAGSAAFVAGTLLSGQLIDRFGLSSIIVSSSVLFLVMALCAMRIRSRQARAPARWRRRYLRCPPMVERTHGPSRSNNLKMR